MIDINLYRSRIGSFSQNGRKSRIKLDKILRRYCTGDDKTGKLLLSILQVASKIVLILALLHPGWQQYYDITPQSSTAQSACWVLPATAYPQTSLGMVAWSRSAQTGLQFQAWGRKQTKNFLAKYVNGNRVKGIYNAHFNIRSLKNKVIEVKNLIKQHSPNILGLSECELRKVNNMFDEQILKIPGYTALFPKSWTSQGYARVVVYVKNSLEFEQLHDLEDDQVQSIWLRGGFKNGKKIYFCHGYREHTSNLGNSLSSQRSNLEIFLSQWEAAAEFNNPAETNEVHICCDMNLDSLDNRWLQPDYHLITLSRLVQNCCNMNNFSQLVKEPTRMQYNAVQNTTSISCIDHVYTNVKHRCSPITVTPCGTSDHDMISYSRYSKEPPIPARTIRKRSYKEFVPEKYLEDLVKVNWNDVLCCEDLDMATDLFTRKLRYILNIHAPWIIFQQRKSFCPWLTPETKQLMNQRDMLKQKAKDIAMRDHGNAVSEEQQLAWAEYKKLRNKINNTKKNEENKYKSKKISDDLDSPSKVWATAKSFMGWKSTGTPSQLESNNKLETKPSKIAHLMNNFFIEKVQKIRKGLKKLPEWFEACVKVMQGKSCNLELEQQ